MRNLIFALLLSVLFIGCQQKQDPVMVYTPRLLTTNEKFNDSPVGKESTFEIIVKQNDDTHELKEEYKIKFHDTLVRILMNKADPSSATERFSYAQFINSQKTTLLVQIADESGLPGPIYILALKGGMLNVASLYRPSTGDHDITLTKGIVQLGRAGYVINNDFYVTNVSARVYLLKRLDPEERIQGEFILSSPDKATLVFLTPTSLYQVHYESDVVFNEKISKPALDSTEEKLAWIRDNFSWEKNKKGITFLKFTDSDRIVDIKEFR